MERYGRIDILVNNVGITCRGSVVDVDEEDWNRVIAVNINSTMLMCKYTIPKMAESGGGSIINMSSIVALRVGGRSGGAAYATSKAGIIALTNTIAVNHGRQNVRANCILPGLIYGSFVGDDLSEEQRDLRARSSALGTEGTPWDVAWAAVFLASDESRWITAVALPVDAGVVASMPLTMLPYLT
jgi:NAD(P)-dependent dehydrogenase (short-subunit alcohol dehydrogenase family)